MIALRRALHITLLSWLYLAVFMLCCLLATGAHRAIDSRRDSERGRQHAERPGERGSYREREPCRPRTSGPELIVLVAATSPLSR
jgi:hypothetical protein